MKLNQKNFFNSFFGCCFGVFPSSKTSSLILVEKLKHKPSVFN